ncbi:MAG: NUDIX domain-containing protein [Nitrospiraceae bacterium]|nr:NUDIX domain-containing protein [Nitrospiraceae bacterium]
MSSGQQKGESPTVRAVHSAAGLAHQPPPLFDAVGCICIAEGKILLLKRHPDKSYPATWGIPTGKVLPEESRTRAIVREMYEETSNLVSFENLALLDTYHVVTSEMSFLYTVYSCHFEETPQISINPAEHTAYGWSSYAEALSLQLVPGLAECLRDARSRLPLPSCQPMLFPELECLPARTSPTILEAGVKEALPVTMPSAIVRAKTDGHWVASFGPPASGKTTTLKAMSLAHSTYAFVENRSILRRSSRLNHYLTEAFEQRDASSFFRFQMEVLHMRFIQSISAPNMALVDESIFSPLAYSRGLLRMGWLHEREYQTFYSHYAVYLQLLPPPKTVLYCHSPVGILLRRIRRRGRKIERLYSPDYIECLHAAFAEVATELASYTTIVQVDTAHLSVEEIIRLYAPPS